MPYWRLSCFYFFYFASLGAFLPYVGPYLKFLGYSSVEIGQLLSAVMATKIVAPLLFGWLADHTRQGLRITQITSFCAAAFLVGTLWDFGFFWLLLVLTLFSFFWNAALPLFEAVTMASLHGDTHHYNRIRLWGSIGFILAVLISGERLDHWGYGALPWILCVLFVTIWLSALVAPHVAFNLSTQDPISLFSVLKKPEVQVFLCSCFLLQAAHAPYYTFYSIYLGENGFQHWLVFGRKISIISVMWTLAVLAEVVIFMLLRGLFVRYSLRAVFLAALLLASLRWLLIGVGGLSILILTFAQLLHAASFAAFHGVAIQLVHQYFVGKTQSRGQSLYGSLSFGAGGAVGTVVSGYYWDEIGGSATFLYAAVLSFIAWLLAFWGLRSQLTARH